MGSLDAGCGEDGGLLSVAELESLVGGSGERRNQGRLRKEQRHALNEPVSSRTRRAPQQERGLIRRTLGRGNAGTRRREPSTPTSSTCMIDSVACVLLPLNNTTRPTHPPVILNGLNGALRIAQESSEVLRDKLWSTLTQVAALRVGLEEDDLMSMTEADARAVLTKVGKSCYLNDAQPRCTSSLLIKCMNQSTTVMETKENARMDSAVRNCGGQRLINCQRLVNMSTAREKVEVMVTLLNATLARDGLKREGSMSPKQPASPVSVLPASGIGLIRALKRKDKSSTIKPENNIIQLLPLHRKSNGCNSPRGGGGGPYDTAALRHELMAVEDSVARFTLAVRSDLAWVKSNAEVESGKLTAVPSLSAEVKLRCQTWGAKKMVAALYSALIRIEKPYFATWRSKTTLSSLTELSIQYVRLRGAHAVGKILIKWANKRPKEVIQWWRTTCKLIRRQEERRAAVEVTRCIRGFLCRSRLRHLRHLRAASMLQMAIRRWLSLKELERRKERKLIENASIFINRTIRVYLAKRIFKRLRTERENEIKAAIQIQSVARGRKEKKRYKQISQAIILVQALVRMFNNRNTLKLKRKWRVKENESIIIVQCWWRCYLSRKQYTDLLNSRIMEFYVTEIQRSSIRMTGRDGSSMRMTGCDSGNSFIDPPMKSIELSRENAAFVIQRSVRCMLARREFQRLSKLNKNIQATSKKVQSAFSRSRAGERHVPGCATPTKSSLLKKGGRNLDETEEGGIQSIVRGNSSVLSNNRLTRIMHSDGKVTNPGSSSTLAAKMFNEIRNTNALGQVEKRKPSFRPSFFRSKPEQKSERGDKKYPKGKGLHHSNKDEDRNLKFKTDQIHLKDELQKISQSISKSELVNATKTAEIARLERELREAKINENQARLEAAQISERDAERMKREASMVAVTELIKVKDRLAQEEKVVDLLKDEKNDFQSELIRLTMAVERERKSGRQEVINLVQELICSSQQIEKEERTDDASVAGEHQDLERKQIHEILEMFAAERLKKMGSETLEIMAQDLANEKIITKDQHDKIQSLSAELSHMNAKLKAVCKEKSHETLVAEGSAILASLDDEDEGEEERRSEMMLNNKAKETGPFIVTSNEEKAKVEFLERSLATAQAKLEAYERKEAQTTSSSMPEHRYSHHPTAPSTSAINGNNEQSSISNSNSIPDIEQKLSSKQSTTKKQIPFSHPAQRKINSNVNSKPPMDHLSRVSSLQAGRRASNANGDSLPIDHHHSKKVLVKPEQYENSNSGTRAMMNRQLPADWEEFWDDSVGASYFFNASTQEATWTLPKGSISEEETILIVAKIEEQVEEDWIEQWDEASSRPYWFNTKKNETTWVKPNSILHSDNNNRAADVIGDNSGLNAMHTAQDNPEEWVAYLDADKGEEYWYNTTTGEVKWS